MYRDGFIRHQCDLPMITYLVQVKPVPDDADEEAEGKQSLELGEPGHFRPQLSADCCHNH